MWGLPQKQNARRAYKIRLCGHLRRYKKIVKKTYIIYINLYCFQALIAESPFLSKFNFICVDNSLYVEYNNYIEMELQDEG